MATRGEHVGKVLDFAHGLSPFGDWLGCTAMTAVLAALFGWMISFWPVTALWPGGFDKNNNAQFLPVYLTSVGVWVVPISVLVAFGIWRDVRTGRREERDA